MPISTPFWKAINATAKIEIGRVYLSSDEPEPIFQVKISYSPMFFPPCGIISRKSTAKHNIVSESRTIIRGVYDASREIESVLNSCIELFEAIIES